MMNLDDVNYCLPCLYIRTKDRFGNTPLHWAVIAGNQEMVELILDKGVDINIRAKNGWTPLHQAAINGSRELSELFINKDADINAKSNSGEIPLDAVQMFVAASRYLPRSHLC